MSRRLSLSILLCATWAAAAAAPRAYAQTLDVFWSPEQPVVGTLFVVRVGWSEPAGGPTSLRGRFADEPLHFHEREGGGRWAIAAMPIDAPLEGEGSLELELNVRWPDGRAETLRQPVALEPGRYLVERLTVAPQFGSPLSPELQRRTEEESARALRVARGAHESLPLWTTSGFTRPRSSRITSGFGNGREFNGQVQSRHMGTDFNGNVGDPVLAAADGVVKIVDQFYLGGNVIYLDHGGGLSTAYLHLSEALVQPGDTVRAGQRIGSVGATGRVTGPHLHWIVRYGGVTVDPLNVVELPTP